jgi:hypothetical protein
MVPSAAEASVNRINDEGTGMAVILVLHKYQLKA